MRARVAPLLGMLLLMSACTGAPTPTPAPGTVAVAASIYPAAYLATQVGGARVDVVRLVPDGAEAHDFEPSPSHLRALANASLVVVNGRGLEPWVERALGALGEDAPPVVALAGQADPSVDPLDPHVWVDPVQAMEMTDRLRAALSALAPEHAGDFTANARALSDALGRLHDAFTTGLASCRVRTFITSHAAYGHLAARYGLEQRAIAGLEPDAEPSPAHLAALAGTMRAQGIGVVLVEPLHAQGVADALAAEVGARLRVIHPLESVSDGERAAFGDYLGLMRENLAALREALGCS